jgi:hypothetical protein
MLQGRRWRAGLSTRLTQRRMLLPRLVLGTASSSANSTARVR